MYVIVCTRPDITHFVRVISRFMKDQRKEHWNAVKWIFMYLNMREMHLIWLQTNGFVDAYMAGDPDGRKSIVVYMFTLGIVDVSWVSWL